MKARVLKKLSKKVAHIIPSIIDEPWKDKYDPIMEEAYEQGSRVKNCLMTGGETDHWGEGGDYSSCYKWFTENYMWLGEFPAYPEGHEYEGLPDTSRVKRVTGLSMIRQARDLAKTLKLNKHK